MEFARKSTALICFCLLLQLPAWAGSAPIAPQKTPPRAQVEASPTDYHPSRFVGNQQPARQGGMLLLVAGISLMFLSPLVLERVNKAV